jgi:hypothetical protein
MGTFMKADCIALISAGILKDGCIMIQQVFGSGVSRKMFLIG